MNAFVLTALILAAAPMVGGRTPAPSQVPTPPKEAILAAPASYEKAASDSFTELAARPRCSETRARAADVTLSWITRREGIAAVRVDLTEFRDGFQTGRFVTLGQLAAASGRIEFPDGRAGLNYHWRLLVRTGDGWAWAANGRFDVPVCPKDEEVGE